MATRPKAVNRIDEIDELIDQAGQAPEQPGEIHDPGQIGDDEMPNDLALAMTLSQIGETTPEAKVIVYKIDAEKKKDVYLYDCTVTEFAEGGVQEIQDCYGEGDYRVRVYYGNRILTVRRVPVGPSRKPKKIEGITPAIDFGAIMAANNAALLAGFKELAIGMKPAAGGNLETIQLITALKPLLAPTSVAVQSTSTDPIDMLTRVLALQREITPLPVNSDGDISGIAILLKAMETFGKPIAEAMSAQKAAQATPGEQTYDQAGDVPQALPAPAIASAAPVSAQEQPVMNELQMKIAVFKPALILMAGANADPYPYACMVLDMFSDAEIAQYINAPDWWMQLQVIIPEATPYQTWFASLRTQVVELLQESPDSASVASGVSTN